MLKQRVVTALIAVAILLSVLFLAPVPVARGVIGVLLLAGAWEWSQFLGTSDKLVRLGFVGVIAVAEILLGFVITNPELHLAVFAVASLWWLAALVWVCVFPTPIPAALAWFGGVLVLVPAYLAMDSLYQFSPWLLLMSLVLIWLADIGAYFSGRAFGRIKLAPQVSPGKTWEGAAGGLVAAALASENKTLAHPASVDSLPTSANQEDHVSMATFAANRLHDIIANVESIVAIELLSAAQGIDFHHPSKSSSILESAHARIRSLSPMFEEDRSLKPDVDDVAALIRSGYFYDTCRSILPSA